MHCPVRSTSTNESKYSQSINSQGGTKRESRLNAFLAAPAVRPSRKRYYTEPPSMVMITDACWLSANNSDKSSTQRCPVRTILVMSSRSAKDPITIDHFLLRNRRRSLTKNHTGSSMRGRFAERGLESSASGERFELVHWDRAHGKFFHRANRSRTGPTGDCCDGCPTSAAMPNGGFRRFV